MVVRLAPRRSSEESARPWTKTIRMNPLRPRKRRLDLPRDGNSRCVTAANNPGLAMQPLWESLVLVMLGSESEVNVGR